MGKLINDLCIGGLLMLCISTMAWAEGDNTPANQPAPARIRLYGQNQKSTEMTYHQDGKKVKISIGNGLGDAFASLIGLAKNTSLGMPRTDMVINMKQYNGLLSKIFYREYAIPANTPITVQNFFIGLTNVLKTSGRDIVTTEPSCHSEEITFTAQAGKDYEVVPSENSSACGVLVLQVSPDGTTQALTN